MIWKIYSKSFLLNFPKKWVLGKLRKIDIIYLSWEPLGWIQTHNLIRIILRSTVDTYEFNAEFVDLLIWDISYSCGWFGISAISELDLGYQLFLCLIWDISYFCAWFGISAISVVDLGYQLFLWLIWDISYSCGWFGISAISVVERKILWLVIDSLFFVTGNSLHGISKRLKGVFANNERGYRLNAIKKRFWSLIILLLYVTSVRRKLLKTSYTE